MKNSILKLDKSDWKLFKLGNLATEISERLQNPKSSNYERFVGLNNFVSGELKIKNWKSTKNVISSAKIFQRGDILFARRNVYLKRASLVNFNGCCSGDAFVLRENYNNIFPGFLVLILNSNLLWEFAISNAAGTMSKRVKWRDLAEFEVLLPPKNRQEEILNIIYSLDETIESKITFLKKYNLFLKRITEDHINGVLFKDKKKLKKIIFGDLGKTFGGLSGKTKKDFGKGEKFITYMNVFNNSKVNLNDVGQVMINKNEKQNELKYGDILITGSSETANEVGMTSVVLDDLENYYLNSFCFGFRLNNFDTLLPEYSRYLLRSNQIRNFMCKHAQGYTRFNISKSTITSKLEIEIPNLEEQKNIVQKLDLIENQLLNIKNNINKSTKLLTNLINQIF